MNDNKSKSPERGERTARGRISKARGWVALAFIGSVGVGLALHTGTGTYSAFGIDQIAAICPLGALETLLTGQTPTWHVLVGLAIVVVLVLLFGKAFCAWLCPTPWLQRLFRRGDGCDAEVLSPAAKPTEDGRPQSVEPAESNRDEGFRTVETERADGSSLDQEPEQPAEVGDAEQVEQQVENASVRALPPVGGARDGFHLDARHAVLGGALVSTAIFGFPVFCLVCPVGLSLATIIAVWHLFQFNELTWGLLVFPAITIAEVVLLKHWCHTICPLGALISLISAGNRTFRPKVDESQCLREKGADCTACITVCPERVDPHMPMIPECTKCGKCVEHCPVQAIKIPFLK